MLYPAVSDLVEKVGSRYHLVNVVAKRAREVADEAADHGIKLEQKPVKLAILELANRKDVKKYRQGDYKNMVRGNVVFMPTDAGAGALFDDQDSGEREDRDELEENEEL